MARLGRNFHLTWNCLFSAAFRSAIRAYASGGLVHTLELDSATTIPAVLYMA